MRSTRRAGTDRRLVAANWACPLFPEGDSPVDAYLRFLSGGCSKDPLDLLRDAGVDMEQPAAIDAALGQFGELVEELDRLL